MELASAQKQAEEALRPFVGQDLTTEVLNEIENTTNGLIQDWAKERLFVHDGRGNLVRGIKVWYDLFDGALRFAFRYLSQPQNIRK
tara:strand:- start:125 stop:382 length:258 start_codon:yes stop_codon:yes gene_type:complete